MEKRRERKGKKKIKSSRKTGKDYNTAKAGNKGRDPDQRRGQTPRTGIGKGLRETVQTEVEDNGVKTGGRLMVPHDNIYILNIGSLAGYLVGHCDRYSGPGSSIYSITLYLFFITMAV